MNLSDLVAVKLSQKVVGTVPVQQAVLNGFYSSQVVPVTSLVWYCIDATVYVVYCRLIDPSPFYLHDDNNIISILAVLS